MSLINSASVWLSEDTKKRTPTIPRKSLSSAPSSPTLSYSQPSFSQPSSFNIDDVGAIEPMSEYQEKDPPTQSQTEQEDSRTSKINEMINKMTNIDNAGNGLMDFKPLNNPIMTTKTDVLGNINDSNSLVPKLVDVYSQSPQSQYINKQSTNYSENNMDLANLSNYKQSYEVPATKPYYTKFGISNNSNIDEKMNDRLSYITHLLEEMQNEKTSNVCEEFVMYTMLGIFMIYIVDSFSRMNKYTR